MIKRAKPMETEIWKDITGYKGRYKVSNLGRVVSCSGKRCRPNEDYYMVLKPDRYGYVSVTLTIDNKPKRFRVHRLVAQEFIPNPYNKLEVNHINMVKTDNRAENLEWCTRKENTKHFFDNGGVINSSCNRKKVVLEDTIIFESISEAARITGFRVERIWKICKGITKKSRKGKWRYYDEYN